MPKKTVASTRRKKNQIAGACIQMTAAAMGAPVHLNRAAGLEVQAEGVVFVLRNFDCADAVPLKDESSPWRRRACAMADGTPGEQWNAAVSDHDRDAWADIAGLESVLAQISQPQSE